MQRIFLRCICEITKVNTEFYIYSFFFDFSYFTRTNFDIQTSVCIISAILINNLKHSEYILTKSPYIFSIHHQKIRFFYYFPLKKPYFLITTIFLCHSPLKTPPNHPTLPMAPATVPVSNLLDYHIPSQRQWVNGGSRRREPFLSLSFLLS